MSATSSGDEVVEDRGARESSPPETTEESSKPHAGSKPFLPNTIKNRLEDQMNHEDLELLERIFEEADEDGGGGLDLDEFKEAMKRIIANKGGILPHQDELAIIFMKVDANCDGTVDWEEFCSYMLMENQLKDVMSSELGVDAPFPNPIRELHSSHRDTLVRISYFPKISYGPEDFADGTSGRYVAVSRDGVMTFWNMDLNLQRTILLNEGHYNSPKGNKTVWVTDCVVLANVKKIAVSTTERDIAFYDCAANNFEKHFVVCGFQHSVLCMDYWYNPENYNESALYFGDMNGQVYVLIFSSATTGLFDFHVAKNQGVAMASYCRIMFRELVNGLHPNVRAMQFCLHDDWVKKVKYYPSLQCFISCATTSEKSLYVGDALRKRISSYINIRKGVLCFDYCSTWNVIVTGGIDHYVRLWNPYLTTKPTSTLKGHCSAVIHIAVNGTNGQFISVSQDKVLKVWDIRDVCCIQTVPGRLLTPGPVLISSIYFNAKNHTLLLGTNVLFAFEKKGSEKKSSDDTERSSHIKPLCKALYNSLFNQVVSACHASLVIVWSLETGEKVIQFSNAHPQSEITAMCFDQSLRRLVTGARNGSVKIWNFNNGNCLRTLIPVDDEEITGIVCTKQRIITVGWSKKVAIYKDSRGDEEECEPRVWINFHKDDILSIDLYGTGTLATASYDGDIKVWSIETFQVTCVLNANDYPRERRPSLIPKDLKKNVMVNNVIFSDLKKQEALEKADEEMMRYQKPVLQYTRSKSFSYRRRSSVERRRSSVMRRKSIDPLCVRVDVKETDHDSGVDCVLFLQARTHATDTATLLSTGSGGWIRAWCMFGGGLAGEFMASSNHRESILCMTSDEKNNLLMTGDTQGYIKIWNITKYCIGEDTSKALLGDENRSGTLTGGKAPRHVTFPGDKRRHQICQKAPPLVFCLRAHLQPIVSIDFIQKHRLLITASIDCSLRLWRNNGQYVGTFGQRNSWNLDAEADGEIPFDLERAASVNSMKLMQSSSRSRWSIAKGFLQVAGRLTLPRSKEDGSPEDDRASSATKSETLREAECRIDMNNILGKFYRPKKRHHMPPTLPKLRNNRHQIVVYTSLKCNELAPIVEPKAPVVTFQTPSNSKPSPRASSSKSDKDVVDHGKTHNRILALSPRDRAKTRVRSSHGTRRIKVQESS